MIYRFFKRLFDIILSLIAMPFVLLVILIFAPIIWLTDRGPVFYNAERLGYKGKVFKMYKLRSMKVNSPNLKNADGSTYNGANDPRVTKVGRFMRKTSIDEFPQFFNVLKGDMSFIGPRAHLTTNYKGYDLLDEPHKKRLDVRPGITGYSQAYFRNAATSAQKMENDVYYAENISLWLDIKILFQTVFSVLGRKNIYVTEASTNGEAPTEASAKEKQLTEAGKK
ncbi:MAG: sugar transferase [Clostridia bacterium]|nr:sugar transferase [Clostridia bacterium]